MAEKPEGRRTTRRWTEWAVMAAPWASLLVAVQEIVDRWVFPHM
ncbi:hypothetical protein ACFWZ2_22085 [Streptomyces sp. NPDC059002]